MDGQSVIVLHVHPIFPNRMPPPIQYPLSGTSSSLQLPGMRELPGGSAVDSRTGEGSGDQIRVLVPHKTSRWQKRPGNELVLLVQFSHSLVSDSVTP